ncbi:hypothetical protein DEO72_LG4g1671 [Vigna unguiculata]|uniref:Uncharacterized protein n=1 Tax=Vigna unguiculata TaxID=3917 RepID=A0A4D6LQE8_VIGUN|nr:hypothetical protein DEO72_LG4g1671 [Vigna unguiculata]
MVLSRFFPLRLPNNPYCAPISLSFQFFHSPLSCCARVFGVEGVSERFASSNPRGMDLIACNSLGSLGETSGVALQWSRRNSRAPISGCSWWCPICITRFEQLRSSRGIHHKCKRPLNPTELYVSG